MINMINLVDNIEKIRDNIIEILHKNNPVMIRILLIQNIIIKVIIINIIMIKIKVILIEIQIEIIIKIRDIKNLLRNNLDSLIELEDFLIGNQVFLIIIMDHY